MRFGTQPITRPNLSLIILELTDTPDPCSFSFLCQAEHFKFYGAEEHFVCLQRASVPHAFSCFSPGKYFHYWFLVLFIYFAIYKDDLKWFNRIQNFVWYAYVLFYYNNNNNNALLTLFFVNQEIKKCAFT